MSLSFEKLLERLRPLIGLTLCSGESRLKRWLFNLAGAASLLLRVATIVLWARSYFLQDCLSRDQVTLTSTVGFIQVKRAHAGANPVRRGIRFESLPQPADARGFGSSLGPSFWNRLGFKYDTFTFQLPQSGARTTLISF